MNKTINSKNIRQKKYGSNEKAVANATVRKSKKRNKKPDHITNIFYDNIDNNPIKLFDFR